MQINDAVVIFYDLILNVYLTNDCQVGLDTGASSENYATVADLVCFPIQKLHVSEKLGSGKSTAGSAAPSPSPSPSRAA